MRNVGIWIFSNFFFNLFAEKVFAGGVPRCVGEKCNGVVKPGEFVLFFNMCTFNILLCDSQIIFCEYRSFIFFTVSSQNNCRITKVLPSGFGLNFYNAGA